MRFAASLALAAPLLLVACGGGGSPNAIAPVYDTGSSSSRFARSSGDPDSTDIGTECRTLATAPNVNWRDSAELDTDQEIVECLSQTLGRAVGYGENTLGGYNPAGNSILTVITKNGSTSVEQQILDAVSSDAHNWIVFDKFDFAEESEVALYRNFCGREPVQTAVGGTEAHCIDYRQWCTDNGFSEEVACLAEFFNNRLNDENLPIRNPVIGANKTIDGRLTNAYFRFNGFAVGTDSGGSENVILTHLDFRGAGHTEDHGLDPDMIRSTGSGTRNVWIHKNTFDLTGDSAFDVKQGAHHITISFNRVMDVKRSSLHGSSDTREINEQIRTTLHHNAFVTRDALYEAFSAGGRRVPLIRRGSSHMFNNLFMNYRKDVLSLRLGASMLWENNMFLTNETHGLSLSDLQTQLARDVDDGNFRTEGSLVWLSDSACQITSGPTEISSASGTVTDLSEEYSQDSRDIIAAQKTSAGQDMADYINATAGKYGEMPFNSPLAHDQAFVLDLGKVPCQ